MSKIKLLIMIDNEFKQIEGSFNVTNVHEIFFKNNIKESYDLLVTLMFYRYLGKDLDMFEKYFLNNSKIKLDNESLKLVKKYIYLAPSKFMHNIQLDDPKIVEDYLIKIQSYFEFNVKSMTDWDWLYKNGSKNIKMITILKEIIKKYKNYEVKNIIFRNMCLALIVRMTFEEKSGACFKINTLSDLTKKNSMKFNRKGATNEIKNLWDSHKLIINNQSHSFESSYYKLLTMAENNLNNLLSKLNTI